MRLAVVIVSFNAPEILRAHLRALSDGDSRPDCVVVADTGTTSAAWAKDEFGRRFAVEVVACGDIGPAGGFRLGAMRAYELGHDYIVFGDDDCIPASDAVARLRAHAERGEGCVCGSYSGGKRVWGANHYLMASRRLLAAYGFHFAPFFMLCEDFEMGARLRRGAGQVHDPEIIVSHPHKSDISAFKWRLFARNSLAQAAAGGRIGKEAGAFYGNLLRACSAALWGRAEFLAAFYWAWLDFMAGRMGRPPGRAVAMPLAGGAPSRRPAYIGVRKRVGAELIPEDSLDGAGRLRAALRLVPLLSGRDVLVRGSAVWAFLPYTALARDVFIEDEREGKVFLLHRNNAAVSVLFMLALAPAFAALLPVFALGLSRRGHYRRMFDEAMRADREFCAKAGRGGGGA